MAYGSGTSFWARGAEPEDGVPTRRNNTNSGNSHGSYQRGESGAHQYSGNGNNYQPPQLTGTYARQQTQIVEDVVRTQVQAETAANNVLASMVGQKQQLENANEDTWAMRTNVVNAQRELKDLQQKAWMKKQRLYIIIGLLGAIDLVLFLRIVQCGGSFFCRH